MNSVYRYRYNYRQYSAPSPVYNTDITESSLTAHQTSIANLGRRKLGYLRVSYRIFKRNFTNQPRAMVWSNTVSSPAKPFSQQSILKKAKGLLYHHCIVTDRLSNLLKRFLLVTLSYMNDMISISIHKELQSCLHLSSSLLLH